MSWIFRTKPVADSDVFLSQPPAILVTLGVELGRGEAQQVKLDQVVVTIPASSDGVINDCLKLRGGFLVSRRFRDAVTAAGVDNIQWFTASVFRQSTSELLKDYWLMNLLGTALVVDQPRSQLTLDAQGRIKFIKRLALRDQTLPSRMVRSAEFLPMIVADDAVRASVEAAECRGVAFIDPAKASW
jgi:hypothetical protein